MAYDASFMTGSETRPVDPIGIGFHHNDQEIADLNDEHHVIHLTDGMLNQALESYDQATDLSGQLHASVRRGEKLSNTSYLLLKSSLKRIVRNTKVGLDPLPAMESLDPYTQRELTIVMENVVTETIKNIWEKIKSIFISMHNKIKTWFIKAFDGAGKLIKQAEALKIKAESLSSSTMKNNSFEMGGAKFLRLSNKVANAQEIVQGVADISEITNTLLSKTAETYNNMYKNIEEALKLTVQDAKNMKDSDASPTKEGETKPASIGDSFNGLENGTAGRTLKNTETGLTRVSNGKVNSLVTQIIGEFFTAAKELKIDTNKEIQGDERWPADKVFGFRNPKDLLGDIMLVLTAATTAVTTVESYSEIKSGYKISPEPIQAQPKEADDNGTFNTLTIPQIISICERVIEAGKTMLNYKLLFDVRDKNTGNLMKQMEQAVSQNSNLKGVGQRHIQNSIQTTVALIKKMQDGETRWAKYAFSVLNKSVVYCRNSLAQY